MIDEEKLAEKYVKSVIDVNAFDWKIVREIYLAFLEGLKAVRPEWHNVADGDLPKCDVLGDSVSITVLNQNGNKVFYNFLEKVWKLETSNKISKVIAWCEIPTFTDKE